MSTAGLRLWDANGNLMVDTTSAVGIVLGSGIIGGNTTASGSLVDANLALGVPFAIITYVDWSNMLAGVPVITFSGTTLTWQFSATVPTGTTFPATWFLYGVK